MHSNTQPKNKDEWQKHIEEYKKSELTQSEFCKQKGLILCRFVYYLRQHFKKSKKSDPLPSFSQVVFNSQQNIQATGIKIELPNGFRCHVPCNTQPEQLKKILGAILSC